METVSSDQTSKKMMPPRLYLCFKVKIRSKPWVMAQQSLRRTHLGVTTTERPLAHSCLPPPGTPLLSVVTFPPRLAIMNRLLSFRVTWLFLADCETPLARGPCPSVFHPAPGLVSTPPQGWFLSQVQALLISSTFKKQSEVVLPSLLQTEAFAQQGRRAQTRAGFSRDWLSSSCT